MIAERGTSLGKPRTLDDLSLNVGGAWIGLASSDLRMAPLFASDESCCGREYVEEELAVVTGSVMMLWYAMRVET